MLRLSVSLRKRALSLVWGGEKHLVFKLPTLNIPKVRSRLRLGRYRDGLVKLRSATDG